MQVCRANARVSLYLAFEFAAIAKLISAVLELLAPAVAIGPGGAPNGAGQQIPDCGLCLLASGASGYAAAPNDMQTCVVQRL